MVAKDFKSEVAEKIREAVRASGMSRYRIARECGVNEAELCRFLAGQNMGIGGLEALAAVLGLEIIVVQSADKRRRG